MRLNPPSFDESMRLQMRLQQIEGYRQAAALQVMVALLVKSDEDTDFKALARKAGKAAEALTQEVFPDEAGG